MNFQELDSHLVGEAWTSTQAYSDLEKLCDLAPRFAGSAGNFAARDFILARFSTYGMTRPHLEAFDYLTWARGECRLAMHSPVERAFRTPISLVYSPDANRMIGLLVDCGMGSAEDFARVLAQDPHVLENKFVMVTSANPENRRTIHRREKYGRAVKAGASGFVYVNHKPGLLAETGSLRPGQLAEIPAVGLAYEEGWELARQARRGPVQVEMTVRNRVQPGQGYHVVGEINGRTRETLIVGAHFDGHDISQGAMDDAAGTVLLLELARILAPLSGQFKRTIRIIAFDAEELGVLGSAEYVQAHAAELDQIALMVNVDGAAGPVASHGFETSGLDDTRAVLRACARDLGYPLALKDRIETASDNFPFFLKGVPSIFMLARPENPAVARGFGHTAADTLDKVAEADLKAATMTLSRMIARLADYEGSLGTHKRPDEIRQILVDYDLEQPLRAQSKWPF